HEEEAEPDVEPQEPGQHELRHFRGYRFRLRQVDDHNDESDEGGQYANGDEPPLGLRLHDTERTADDGRFSLRASRSWARSSRTTSTPESPRSPKSRRT